MGVVHDQHRHAVVDRRLQLSAVPGGHAEHSAPALRGGVAGRRRALGAAPSPTIGHKRQPGSACRCRWGPIGTTDRAEDRSWRNGRSAGDVRRQVLTGEGRGVGAA